MNEMDDKLMNYRIGDLIHYIQSGQFAEARDIAINIVNRRQGKDMPERIKFMAEQADDVLRITEDMFDAHRTLVRQSEALNEEVFGKSILERAKSDE